MARAKIALNSTLKVRTPHRKILLKVIASGTGTLGQSDPEISSRMDVTPLRLQLRDAHLMVAARA
jgi:hypothetical protein